MKESERNCFPLNFKICSFLNIRCIVNIQQVGGWMRGTEGHAEYTRYTTDNYLQTGLDWNEK